MRDIKPIGESKARINVSTNRGVIFSMSMSALLEAHFCPGAYRWPEQIGEYICVSLVDGDKVIEEAKIPMQEWVDKWQRSRKD